MNHWINEKNEREDLPSETFFDEIEAICKKYGLSICHEDGWGAFEIVPFDEDNIEWLRAANFTQKAAEIIRKAAYG